MKKRFSIVLTAFFCLFLFFAVTSAPARAASAELNKTSASIYIDKTVKLRVNNTSSDVVWSSSDPAVAKVSSTGRVTGLKKGTATIRAKVDSQTLSCTVTVKRAVSISDKTITVTRGKSKKITVTLRPSGKYNVYSAILDSDICKINWGVFNRTTSQAKCTGTIFGKKRGTTYIAFTNNYNSEIYLLKVIVK